MLIKIAIADDDNEYVKRLVYGLEKYNNLNISVYTEAKNLENALQTKKFDILLFTPQVFKGQISLPKHTAVILLADGVEIIPDVCKGFVKIKKYQQISGIYHEMISLYAEVCGSYGMTGDNRTRKILFYSPIGGSGKTTLSLATAVRLARGGHSVLYINLEELASDTCYLPPSAGKGLSELLERLDSDINFSLKIQGLANTKMENFFYLNHFESPNDIYEMKEDELEKLITIIGGTNLYEYLIVDMGTSLNSKTMILFECVDQIVLIDKTDEAAKAKMQCFLKQLHIINEYAHKMLRVLNFGTEYGNALEMQIPTVEIVQRVRSAETEKIILTIAGAGLNQLADILAD